MLVRLLRVEESERYTAYVYDDHLPIARLYKIDNGVKVHMYTDDYEFECDSIDTAIPLIRIRWDRNKINL